MRIKKTFQIIVILGLFSTFCQFNTRETVAQEEQKNIDITVNQSYVSRYIWRGLDLYSNNDGAYQPSIDFSFPKLIPDTVLSVNVWSSFPLSSGHVSSEELNYTLTASRDFQDFNLSAIYLYVDYPKANKTIDYNEYALSYTLFKIPLLPFDVSTTLFAGYSTEVSHGGPDNGWHYSWSLNTDIPLGKSIVTQNDQALSLGVTNWGTDGVAGLKPSSLYATDLSLLTSYNAGKFSITPGFHYVLNHEEITNDEDEVFVSVDITYSF